MVSLEEIAARPDELLVRMVESVKQYGTSHNFMLLSVADQPTPHLYHYITAIPVDEATLSELSSRDHIRLVGSGTVTQYAVTAYGYDRYRELKEAEGSGVQRLQTEIQYFLQSDEFRTLSPSAHAKWLSPEGRLWAKASEYTVIGHLVRESMILFTNDVIARFSVSAVDPDTAKVINRLGAAVKSQQGSLGATEYKYLISLVDLWRPVNDLTQRQEHGAAREATPLTWRTHAG